MEDEMKLSINKLPDQLLPSELKNLSEFLKQIKGSDNTKLWFRWERSSGIGVSVYVRCGNIEKDITDYKLW